MARKLKSDWGIEIKLRLGNQNSNRFKTLQEIVGVEDVEQLVRDALQIYEHLALETKAGTKFYKQESNGEIVENPLFGKVSEKDTEESSSS